MALKAGRVGVNRADVDELGHVTAGGITPEERAKLEKALVTPVTTPTEKELVGVGTANEQIMIKVGSGLSLSGETSPFTLNSSGGGSGTVIFEREPLEVTDSKIVIITPEQLVEYDSFDVYVSPAVGSKSFSIKHLKSSATEVGVLGAISVEENKIITGYNTYTKDATNGIYYNKGGSRGGYELTLSSSGVAVTEIGSSPAYGKRGLPVRVIAYKNT